jgi:hypothetical protein
METLIGVGTLVAVVIWFVNSKGGPRHRGRHRAGRCRCQRR